MNLLIKFLSAFFILNALVSLSIAEFTYSLSTQTESPNSKELTDKMNYYKNQAYDSTKFQHTPASVVNSEDISQGTDNTVYFSSPDSPIKIKRTFDPMNKTNYLLGDPIGIYVEISSTNEDLSDLSILEVIDDNLEVLNISNEYGKISNFDALCQYYKERNRDPYLECDNFINKNGCQLCPTNGEGIKFKKNDLRYPLFIF